MLARILAVHFMNRQEKCHTLVGKIELFWNLSYGQKIEFTCEDNAGFQERAGKIHFSAGVANQITGFASSCPLINSNL